MVHSKPTFNSNPLISSIFSSSKEVTESHITKIPPKSAKQKEQTTTAEPTEPPPSFVEQKIGRVFEKILTISQLANSLRSSPANLEENENGFTMEDQTNPPPSFVEQKVGRIVEKLFRLSQFASNVRERFHQPNHVFEFVTEKDSKEDDLSIDFDNYFKDRKDSEEQNGNQKGSSKYIPLIRNDNSKETNYEGIEAIKNYPTANKIWMLETDENITKLSQKQEIENVVLGNSKFSSKDTLILKANQDEANMKKDVNENVNKQSKKEDIENVNAGNSNLSNDILLLKANLDKESTKKNRGRNLVDEEAFKVYLFNQGLMLSQNNIENQKSLVQKMPTEDKTNLNDVIKSTSTAENDIITLENIAESVNKNNNTNEIDRNDQKFDNLQNDTTNINVNLSTNNTENSDKNEEVHTLKQTAEQVGYFVLEIFASIVGLTLGAVSQINHAFHQSNNTILEGLYNSTH